MSKSLDPDQDRHYVGSILGPNYLQRLSVDKKSPLARKELSKSCVIHTFSFTLDLCNAQFISDCAVT